MAFVYKYISQHGKPQYIGKVMGDSFNDLERRISQHHAHFGGRETNWAVWYIDGLTAADADAVETILIAKNKPVYNKAKTSWGRSEYFAELPLEWKMFSPAPKTNKAYRQKTDSSDVRVVVMNAPSFRCNCCGRWIEGKRPNFIHLSYDAMVGTVGLDMALVCNSCEKLVSEQLRDAWKRVFNLDDHTSTRIVIGSYEYEA